MLMQLAMLARDAVHNSISQNTTTFHKTQPHFTKHNKISQNTTTFQMTERVGTTPLVCDCMNPSLATYFLFLLGVFVLIFQ